MASRLTEIVVDCHDPAAQARFWHDDEGGATPYPDSAEYEVQADCLSGASMGRAEREGYQFPLLADFWPHGAVAQAYGVFNDVAGIANRGTFVIDKAGVVRFAEMNMPGEARDQQGWRKALGEAVAA